MKHWVFMVLIAAGSAFNADPVLAQFLRGQPAQLPPDVLVPEPTWWWIAPQLGVNLNKHPGDFTPLCPTCSFSDASGTGIIAGVQIEHRLNSLLHAAVKLLYDDRNAQASTILPNRVTTVVNPTTQLDESVAVNQERTADVKLAYFVINPVVQLYPIGNLYLFAGPGIGFAMTSTYTLKEKILDPGYLYSQTHTTEVTIEDGDIDKFSAVHGLRLDLRAGVGFDLPLSRSVSFSPEVSYDLPLTTIAADDNWKAEAIHIVAVLKIAL